MSEEEKKKLEKARDMIVEIAIALIETITTPNSCPGSDTFAAYLTLYSAVHNYKKLLTK